MLKLLSNGPLMFIRWHKALFFLAFSWALVPINANEESNPTGVHSAAIAEPTVESLAVAGPYNVERLREADGLRDGPGYRGATIYYPAETSHPLASVVIVPGWGSSERSIQGWGPFFASHGIVTMTIGTNNPPKDFPKDRADALIDAIATLAAENTREESPIFQRLDLSRIAVSGWSMGGGGAQLAAVQNPTLKAAIGLCPWHEPGGIFNHAVPLLIIGGENDRRAPFNEHALIHYCTTPSTTPKLLFEVRGAGHWVANGPKGIYRDTGNGDVGRIALAWLKVFLVGDERYRKFLLTEPESASRFETNIRGLMVSNVASYNSVDASSVCDTLDNL